MQRGRVSTGENDGSIFYLGVNDGDEVEPENNNQRHVGFASTKHSADTAHHTPSVETSLVTKQHNLTQQQSMPSR